MATRDVAKSNDHIGGFAVRGTGFFAEVDDLFIHFTNKVPGIWFFRRTFWLMEEYAFRPGCLLVEPWDPNLKPQYCPEVILGLI